MFKNAIKPVYIKIRHYIYYTYSFFLTVILNIVCLLIKPFGSVNFFLLESSRIGHFIDGEYVLRKIKQKYFGNKKVVFIMPPKGNTQIEKMYKREVTCYISAHLYFFLAYFVGRAGNNFLKKIFISLNEGFYNEHFNNGSLCSLKLTKRENDHGNNFLKSIGIEEDDWFVCFNNRDNAFLESYKSYADWSYHSFRNDDILSYELAMEYILAQGGKVVRMGAIAEKRVSIKDTRIIDYPFLDEKSDFYDIFMLMKCRFYVGPLSGITQVPFVFNIPLVIPNLIPLEYRNLFSNSIFSPKIILDKKINKNLNYDQIINTNIKKYYRTNQYKDENLEVVNNSSEEIKQLVEEMYLRLEDTKTYSNEDDNDQERFFKLFPKAIDYRKQNIRVGAKFIQEYKNLL